MHDDPSPITTPDRPRLSKSRLVDALQCERRLWLAVNRPDLQQVDALRESVFATGNEVGEMARRLATDAHGTGELVDVKESLGWVGGLRRCREALAEPGLKVLFEAPFAHDGLAVICDIVVRHPADSTGRRELHLIEVKSSTSTNGKPYVQDTAIQAWCMSQCGFPPDRVFIRLLDRAFVYPGGERYQGLFGDEDVTEAVRAFLPEVPALLELSRDVAAGAEPQIRTGAHCGQPYGCGFLAHCQRWEAERFGPPPEFPVTLLGGRNTGKLTVPERERIAAQGWADLRDLPEGFPADARGQAIVRATREGQPWRLPGLALAIQALPYPRYYFDFETIAPAIPRWPGTRPYQQVPFQWSCHVEHRDGRVEHHEFLDISGGDPRQTCAESVANLLGGIGGVVVVYHQAFEAACLADLARDVPKHAAALRRAIGKLRDLLPIVREHYYHPGQRGSYSIKAVLPTVAPELDYGELEEVQHGLGAQLAWREAASEHTAPERRDQLRERMLAYCRRDTEAMLVLARRLGSA
jgi:hypothetical protein